jgi:hypothetical protein
LKRSDLDAHGNGAARTKSMTKPAQSAGSSGSNPNANPIQLCEKSLFDIRRQLNLHSLLDQRNFDIDALKFFHLFFAL